MTLINFAEARLIPLTTDDDIETRARDLIGRANVRQLWLLFLNSDDVQLPYLVPISALPSEPTQIETLILIERIVSTMEKIGAVSVVTVWERYGSARLTPQDAAWARALDESCAGAGIVLRGMLLSHRTGVCWINPADYTYVVARTLDLAG
jgi:hypothetical protein